MTMRFGLQIGSFTWPGGAAETAGRLGAIAAAAEEAGFSSISVMDHFVQIPAVGREWEDMLESTATLGFLAASTSSARLGTLVTVAARTPPAAVAPMPSAMFAAFWPATPAPMTTTLAFATPPTPPIRTPRPPWAFNKE